MEQSFSQFFLTEATNDADMADIRKSIKKLPKEHQKLLNGYRYSLEGGNTLKNDKGHIGLNDLKNKKIIVAAPWNYSREFSLMHELAHCVWDNIMTKKLKSRWAEIMKKTKEKMPKLTALRQSNEEIFCMTYATYYASHAPETYKNSERENFIKQLP